MEYSPGTEINDPLICFSIYLDFGFYIRLLFDSFQMWDSKSYRINCICRNRGLTASMDQSLGIPESTECVKSQRSWNYVRIWNCLLKNACISRLHNCKGKECSQLSGTKWACRQSEWISLGVVTYHQHLPSKSGCSRRSCQQQTLNGWADSSYKRAEHLAMIIRSQWSLPEQWV